jgi:hypothetical protein
MQVFFIDSKSFQSALTRWFPLPLDESVCRNVLRRLDEYNIGGVNVTALDDFAGTKSLQTKIAAYIQNSPPSSSSETLTVPNTPGPERLKLPSDTISRQRSRSSDQSWSDESSTPIITEPSLQTPLLIWVDDNPANNARHVAYAKAEAVPILEMSSTAEAKIWIDQNLGTPSGKFNADFLLANNTYKEIRFITDNVRFEMGESGQYLNPLAGDDLLRFIRGRRLSGISVLVYCGKSIASTRYVEDYVLAGSTTWAPVVRDYIRGLARGFDDSAEWVGFDVKKQPSTAMSRKSAIDLTLCGAGSDHWKA